MHTPPWQSFYFVCPIIFLFFILLLFLSRISIFPCSCFVLPCFQCRAARPPLLALLSGTDKKNTAFVGLRSCVQRRQIRRHKFRKQGKKVTAPPQDGTAQPTACLTRRDSDGGEERGGAIFPDATRKGRAGWAKGNKGNFAMPQKIYNPGFSKFCKCADTDEGRDARCARLTRSFTPRVRVDNLAASAHAGKSHDGV